MEFIFSDDGLMQKLNVTHKLRKVLQREGKGYQSALHRRVAVGLSESEFAVCVKLLELTGWCTVSQGERGAVLLTLNEVYRDTTIFTPAEVIADAMGQQKP